MYWCVLKTVNQNSSVECDFCDINQCGYIDISDGPLRWMRTYRSSKTYTLYKATIKCSSTIQLTLCFYAMHFNFRDYENFFFSCHPYYFHLRIEWDHRAFHDYHIPGHDNV